MLVAHAMFPELQERAREALAPFAVGVAERRKACELADSPWRPAARDETGWVIGEAPPDETQHSTGWLEAKDVILKGEHPAELGAFE